jgi:hypothetical protein
MTMASNKLSISLTIPAAQEEVWKKIADWKSQGDWMLQTKVWVTSEQVEGVGTSIAAFTGPFYFLYPRFKTLGLLDLMVVTQWQPPQLCDVDHVGKILKGSGTFQLTKISETETRFDWSETIIAPKAMYLLVAPFLYVGVRISLARFARSFT